MTALETRILHKNHFASFDCSTWNNLGLPGRENILELAFPSFRPGHAQSKRLIKPKEAILTNIKK